MYRPTPLLRALLATGAIAALTPGISDQAGWEFTLSGSPRVDKIDDAMKAVMKANDVHQASLAIVMGTRLIFAKGYTYGPRGARTTLPTTVFRQASCSKFLTALAIMQLIEEGKLTRDTKMQDVLHLTPHRGQKLADGIDKITVQELLEMRSGMANGSPFEDVAVSKATGKALPVGLPEVQEYAASEKMVHSPGLRSGSFYSNTDFTFLGYIVAKLRGTSNLAEALKKTMLDPLNITRIRASRSLKARQLADEADYYSNPYQTAPSVMSPPQPQVELEYGDENLQNFEGGGGLSAAATDYARILAALNEPTDDYIFKKDTTYMQMLNWSYDCYKDKRFASGAFGFYGLDSCQPIPEEKGRFEADKGGYLETSQNAIYFQTGGLGYVVCWDGHTPKGEAWYPAFESVIETVDALRWEDKDLFPDYGMPSLHPVQNIRPMLIHKARLEPKAIGDLRRTKQ